MKILKSKAAMHRQALQRSVFFLIQQPLTSMVTILMIALVLVLFALFGNLSRTLNQWTTNWQHSGHILLYLRVPTLPEEASRLLTQIKTMSGVDEAVLNTPQQGLESLYQQGNMDDVMRYLPDNPLPFVIDVVPARNINHPDYLEKLFQQLKAYPQVEEASLDMAWMKRLFGLLHFLSSLLNGLNMLLAVTVILIVGNTLRLIIRDRTDEMIVFKLIGANDGYIMRPFLYSGIWYGFLSALLAWICVNCFLATFNQKLAQVTAIYPMHYQISNTSWLQSFYFLIGASFLGWIGASLSARWILRSVD